MSEPEPYRRILLAEDEEAMRAYLVRALEKARIQLDLRWQAVRGTEGAGCEPR